MARTQAQKDYLRRKHLASAEVVCACGCGSTIRAISTSGVPQRYVSGHNGRKYGSESDRKAARASRDKARHVVRKRIPGARRKPITFEVDEDGCHICTSHAPRTHGYPTLFNGGKTKNMHRVLYIEAFGDPGDAVVVRHTCDKRLCINLEHLVPGTQADNNADATERRRWNPRRGDEGGAAKLSKSRLPRSSNQ